MYDFIHDFSLFLVFVFNPRDLYYRE